MLNKTVYIHNLQSVSALGFGKEEVNKAYDSNTHFFTFKDDRFQGIINSKRAIKELENLSKKYKFFNRLDRTVQLAMLVSSSLELMGLKTGVNFSSSRGATQLLEKTHQQFLEGERLSSLTSPTTTLGNISSWVAQQLSLNQSIDHSMTCSSGLLGMVNAIAWIQSGMAEQMVVGASEAALTPYTFTHLDALKIYSKRTEKPCLAGDLTKTENTLVLGEASSVLRLNYQEKNAQMQIVGIGTYTEPITHPVDISEEGVGFQKTMEMATEGINTNQISAIITHTPGTLKGDKAELFAIRQFFSKHQPLLFNNKQILGHTYAVSGLLSLEMAYYLFQNNSSIPNESYILINTAGFGGIHCSVLVKKC